MTFRDEVFSGLAVSGECQLCGCTDEESCPGGCIWANAAATLCSRCAREAPPDLGDDLDDYELDD
jgi:hypothetical protein